MESGEEPFHIVYCAMSLDHEYWKETRKMDSPMENHFSTVGGLTTKDPQVFTTERQALWLDQMDHQCHTPGSKSSQILVKQTQQLQEQLRNGNEQKLKSANAKPAFEVPPCTQREIASHLETLPLTLSARELDTLNRDVLKIIGIERPADILDDDKRKLMETYFRGVETHFKERPCNTMYNMDSRKRERERKPLRDVVQSSLMATTMMQQSPVINPYEERDCTLSVANATAALTEALNLQDPLVSSDFGESA